MWWSLKNVGPQIKKKKFQIPNVGHGNVLVYSSIGCVIAHTANVYSFQF